MRKLAALHLMAVLAAGLPVAGCGPDAELLVRGPKSLQNIDANDVARYAENQTKVLRAISQDAGLGGQDPANPGEWKQFVIAAFGYADGQCEDYIEALRRLDIRRRQTIKQINTFGTGTMALLGIAQAASVAIAVTGVAFGLAQSTVDNLAGGLLYELPPSDISDLVTRLRVAYTNSLTEANWQSRATSFRTIRSYVQFCLPATIETNIKKSIAVATPRGIVAPGVNTLGTPPTVTVVPPNFTTTPPPPTGKEPVQPNPVLLPQEQIVGAIGDELSIRPAWGAKLQGALCLAPDTGTITFGEKTRAAIALFRETPDGKQQSSAGGSRSAPKGLSGEEISFLINQTCDRSCYSNAYERYAFGSANQVEDLMKRLAKALPDVSPPSTSRLCDARSFIAKVQVAKQVTPANGILTPAFVDALPRGF